MLLAADWRLTGGVLKIARRMWEVGVAGSPVIGRRLGVFSTLLQQPGLWASTDGVLATKSVRKMLARVTGQLAYTPTRGLPTRRLDISRTGQLAE